jgi:hypothetical protein
MGALPIQMPFGLRVIGDIEEGSGFGFQAIGQDVRNPMPNGCLAVGNQEEEAGSGSPAIGNTDKSSESGVWSSEKKYFLNSELRTPNS